MKNVPGYDNFVSERFERCRQLYWASRKRVNRLNIKPESLLPRIPDVDELRPFPTHRALVYTLPEASMRSYMRSISVSPNGQWLAGGDNRGYVSIWEVSTTRLMCRRKVARNRGEPVYSVRWNPNPKREVLAVCVGDRVLVLRAGLSTCGHGADVEVQEMTEALLRAALTGKGRKEAAGEHEDGESGDKNDDEIDTTSSVGSSNEKTALKKKTTSECRWLAWDAFTGEAEDEILNQDDDNEDGKSISNSSPAEPLNGARSRSILRSGVCITLSDWISVRELVWHAKGDYFVTRGTSGSKKNAVLVHQMSKCTTASLFRKVDKVQSVGFHPTRPFIFLATMTHLRVYSLTDSPVVCKKKFRSSARQMSCLAVHPSGDHVLTGTCDMRVCWFDLDGKDTPYKTYQYHGKIVRQVAFHAKYNLMASCSDDGTVRVLHARVYDDLMRQPLIVPVRTLKGHNLTKDNLKLGVLDIAFHPTQPWIFSSGGDGNVILYQNLH